MGAESLQAACELAFVVARDDTESEYAVEPPTSMRSFLYVSELPRRAITVAQQAIEDDSEFRARVAARASEDQVGRAGYLWLHRPTGWAQEFEMLTADPDDDLPFADAPASDGLPFIGAASQDDLPFAGSAASDGLPFASTTSEDPVGGSDTAEPDHELEEVYNELLSSPVELVKAQPPEPEEPDYSFDPGETFSPASPPIADAPMADAPMATVSPIGAVEDRPEPPPPSFELSSLGIAAVTDRADYDLPTEHNFASFGQGDSAVADDESELDFEADALENELSSLRGLVDRLAGERDTVVTSLTADEVIETADGPTVGGRALETEIMALESDLDSARHELTMAQADLATSRQEREEAQRQHSDTLKRQVELEKELATVRDERVQVENQASEAQVSAISLEDKLARSQTLLEEAERERNVIKSQLDIMTSERNQLREDRIAIKAERDDLHTRVADVEEKSGGVDVGELSSSNKTLTTELEATSRELARMIAQAESFEEQIKTSTSSADSLKTEKVELTSRLADTDLALETTRTQHEALKSDSERLAAEVGTLRAERDGLQSQLTELQSSLADVLNEQAETRQRNDTDRRTLNELRVERDVLLARMNDLEQSDREYETRINSLVRERDDLVVARDDLINERGQLRGEAAASSAEKDQMLDKLRTVEARIGPLETELQAERRQREELANRLLELDDIAEQNAAELARITDERTVMSNRLDELQAELVEAAEVRVEKDSLASQLSESERRYEDEASRNHQKLTELSEQLAAGETARTTLEQQLAETVGELDTIRLDYEENSRELTRQRLAEESVTSTLGEVRTELDSVRADFDETKQELEQLRVAEENAITALAEARMSDESAASQLVDVQQMADTASAALAEAEIALEAKNVELDTKTAELDAKGAELEAKTAELDARTIELDDKNSELQSKVSDLEAKTAEVETLKAEGASALLASPSPGSNEITSEDEQTGSSADAKLEPASDPSIELSINDTVDVDMAQVTPLTAGPLQAPSSLDSTDGFKRDGLSAPDGASFDWPPPGNESTGTESLEDEIEAVTSLDAQDDVGPDVGGDLGREIAPGDEDDLDEVSELISKTVSGFNVNDALGVDSQEIAPESLDVKLDGIDIDADADAEDSVAGQNTTQVLPQLTPAPPSIFGASNDTKSDEPAEAAAMETAEPSSDDPADPSARRYSGRKRRQIEIPSDILDDEVAVAQFVVSSPDVVLLVDGDSVAKLGWPSLPVAQQRDALVTYLADLSTSSGAAPDVVFDGRIGDDQSLPASRAVRIRLSTPPTEPAAALDELVDAYPEQWPIALVTDDTELAGSANERGAAVLNNGQLLDLFIAE